MTQELPCVVLVGRPNVGKSTLFNRLIRKNRAITHDRPGVTRDRLEGIVKRDGLAFNLVDTGGITLNAETQVAQGPEELRGLELDIFRQTQLALENAQLAALVVDAKDGLLPVDEHLAAFLRKQKLPVICAVNKVDGLEKEDLLLADFYALGLPLQAVSAEHGHNIQSFLDTIFELLPNSIKSNQEKSDLRLALLGRPNAGKSSLINALAGAERVIVSDMPGTTRDSIDVHIQKDDLHCVFVDTAGIRRKTKIEDKLEKYSVDASLKSAAKANVTLVLLDAVAGVCQQDKRLLALLDKRKIPFMILLSKIDLLSKSELRKRLQEVQDLLAFCRHIPIICISALEAINLDAILPLALEINQECSFRVGTGQLNRAMTTVLQKQQPPVVKRSRAKFFYLTQAESEPPTFVFFVSDAERVPETYVRYLENALRQLFGIKHAPMRLHLRSSHTKIEKKTRPVKKEGAKTETKAKNSTVSKNSTSSKISTRKIAMPKRERIRAGHKAGSKANHAPK